MCYQVAQKIHAATDLHDPESGYRNDRPRDIVDLVLVKRMIEETGRPDNHEIKAAALDVFAARANDARLAGRVERQWPVRIVAYDHWKNDFDRAAQSAGLDMGMIEAIDCVNEWIDEIDRCGG